MARGISKSQQVVLDYVNDFQKAYGYTPTIRDIARDLHKSPSTIHASLVRLQANGHIERKPAAVTSTREIVDFKMVRRQRGTEL